MLHVSSYLARFVLAFGFLTTAAGYAPATLAMQSDWVLQAVNAPAGITPGNRNKTLVVAIVDDGIRITHQDLTGFIWHNPLELPGNYIDDDGNGYVDDINGWDVSDGNNDVTPPPGRLEQYSHGTRLAGLVAQIARRAYGDAAPDFIRIMPVKSMSDDADKLYIKEGFAGIRYAIDAGADIIICAWGINQISRSEARILAEAEDRGILIVASAGNFPQELEQYPAAYPSVIAVTALDREGRLAKKSSFGQFVDIAAPGLDIRTSSASSDSAYETTEGTSFAAAMTAAAAALVGLEHPGYSAAQIYACLISSADIFDQIPEKLSGKTGAGKLNIRAAVKCDLLRQPAQAGYVLSAPKGFLHLKTAGDDKASWLIKPPGQFKGIRFRPTAAGQFSGKGTLKFYSEKSPGATPIAELQLDMFPESIYVPGSVAYVTLEAEADDPRELHLLEYEFETINFSTLYCDGTEQLKAEGTINDGSGANDYSPASDCKWLITAPEGQVIHFRFVEFDTEARTDFIYFFNGAGTHEDIIARFSGPDIPPDLTTWHNQVLVWFVTDRQNQAKGWKAEVSFKTPEKSNY